ncbi:alpha/beta fold hydrolase [Streptomyces sp. WM6372]|uniref:alpha/beta fold hydrolase n=1 Tax=Streptomyces sp. WM6372 TaxID=1415555 RepID=UPI000ACE05FA|nr:alpha/beta fold hydrolase [Streptomyces sp. WM6372]
MSARTAVPPPDGRQVAPADAEVTVRTSFRFSADGLRAACVATGTDGRHFAEGWSLGPSGPRPDLRTDLGSDPAWTQLLPLDGTSVLASWYGRGGAQSLARLTADGHRDTVSVPGGRPLRLLPAPEGAGLLALGVSGGAARDTLVLAVRGDRPRFEVTARVAGTLLGGTVLGHRVLFTRLLDDEPRPVVLDLRDGGLRDLTAQSGPAHVLAAAAGRVLLARLTPEGNRLALADLDGDAPLRAVHGDTGLPGSVHPLALDPDGDRLALLTTSGARSFLTVLDPVSGTARQIGMPPGDLLPFAAWTGHGLWLPHSDPGRPRTLGWVPPAGTALELPAPARPDHQPARVETFPGAGGPVEAVLYGPDWRTARQVVLALHGGPNSRWTLGFDPFLQALAAAGLAVVAPNQRGSTGYGAAHTLAISGRWGGPDLADVTAVGRFLTRERGAGRARPALYGVSYGAFLALLAAAAEPDGWSACAAVAPFLSGPRLHADGSAQVRSMVERLDGLTPVRDRLGPRDVERLAPALAAPLLLVHGALDDSVPVGHSRALAARLTSLGRRPGTDFHYLELPDRGHAALGAGTADPVVASVVRFLTGQGHPAPPGSVSAPPDTKGGDH